MQKENFYNGSYYTTLEDIRSFSRLCSNFSEKEIVVDLIYLSIIIEISCYFLCWISTCGRSSQIAVAIKQCIVIDNIDGVIIVDISGNECHWREIIILTHHNSLDSRQGFAQVIGCLDFYGVVTCDK